MTNKLSKDILNVLIRRWCLLVMLICIAGCYAPSQSSLPASSAVGTAPASPTASGTPLPADSLPAAEQHSTMSGRQAYQLSYISSGDIWLADMRAQRLLRDVSLRAVKLCATVGRRTAARSGTKRFLASSRWSTYLLENSIPLRGRPIPTQPGRQTAQGWFMSRPSPMPNGLSVRLPTKQRYGSSIESL